MDSTIIKINSDLPSANADATFRRKVAYLSRRSPICLEQQVRNMSYLIQLFPNTTKLLPFFSTVIVCRRIKLLELVELRGRVI
ncbi:MAG: hypothetical protein LBB88_05665 [Planctomycetaceae bacterium]|nr:hypothetical protein [Planctomycetaceae bacterium]